MKSRFTPDELNVRANQARRNHDLWSGPYPYRECAICFEQIHVGGVYICDECLEYERAPSKANEEK